MNPSYFFCVGHTFFDGFILTKTAVADHQAALEICQLAVAFPLWRGF